MVWHEIYVRMWLRYQLNAFNFNSYLCRETENDRSTTCTGTKTFSSVKCHMLLRLQHQLHCGERGVHQAYTTIAANMCCTPSPRYVEAADWFRFVFAEPFLSPLSLSRCTDAKKIECVKNLHNTTTIHRSKALHLRHLCSSNSVPQTLSFG